MSFFPFDKNKNRYEIAEFIFKNYYKTAYYTAYQYCDNKFIAEEAAQETIFKAINNFDQLKDSGKLESWLKTVARNAVFDLLKKMGKEKPYDINDFEDMGINPLSIVENEEIIMEIRRIIRSLEEPYHATIVLYYYKDMKIKEISSILNIPEGTIKSILYRVRDKIKREMIKKGFIEGLGEGEDINES
ncbi:sigma-70 family RNA polymerase sigma factor [Pelotomaculum isophthalicicum JI]|uniref:Sigma-70 family RNA polymerase sigma factor n=1 Tax=Pelotomaculum isophthalicicum JI TaxID=947010 RepID=A0A9X4JVX0_9FIRM|nr:sigma-70 family RNA polymerase sigma factor [Pelotomaculum isophthalicicum]MDF9408113.1 sigma-70 family RNA polymerase sigma factor [Pelotomaculum isophthalicicum JI]